MLDSIRLKHTEAGRAAVEVSLLAAGGATLRRERLSPSPTASQIRKVAKSLGIAEHREALEWFALRHEASGLDEMILPFASFAKMGAEPETQYLLREITSKDAERFATFREALVAARPAGEYRIDWKGVTQTAAADIDYHETRVPSPAVLRNAVNKVEPVPAMWWITKHGGLRLIYHGMDGYEAEDLAAVAALQIQIEFPHGTVELKHDTRRPPGEWHECKQTSECGWLRSISSGEALGSETAEWLDERGLVVGLRYTHDRCPVNPYPGAERNPGAAFVVAEHYIRCWICEKDDVKRGSRDAGYFPLAVLAGSVVSSTLRNCLRHFTHWSHARFVLAQELPPLREQVARAVYRAMLRLAHPDDVRVERVFWEGGTGVVRMRGYWATGSGEPLRLNNVSATLASLPATMSKDGTVIPARVEELSQAIDLSVLGYPPLSVLWGCRLTETQPSPPGRIYTVLQVESLRSEHYIPRRAQYVTKDRRMPLDEAWAVIESAVPGVQRDVVRLLIVAKGCSEHHAGLPPMLFLSGPAGSGKTATPQLAAAICGDSVDRIPYDRDRTRLFNAIRTARTRGSFANFDEFLKGAKLVGVDPLAAVMLCLEFDQFALTHMLYTGSVPLGDLPVLLWTDTVIPDEVQQHSQIGRRMHYCYMPETQSWEKPLAEAGVDRPGALRLAPDLKFCEAANAILSDVRDEFFADSSTDFAVAAERLGFKKLAGSDRATERFDAVRALFKMVCETSGGVTIVPGAEQTRFGVDDTWRMINMNHADSLAVITWERCGTVEELDLRRALGASCVVRIETRERDGKMVLRFTGDGRINGDIG